MKKTINIFCFACLLFFFSCDNNVAVRNEESTNTPKQMLSAETINVSFDEGIIRITPVKENNSQRTYKINYTIGKKTGSSVIINNSGNAQVDILEQTIEALYDAMIEDYSLDSIIVSISIDDGPYVNKSICANSSVFETNNKTTISGKCMPISNYSLSDEALLTKVKKWMYRNEKPYNEQTVECICNAIKSFHSNENIWHANTGEEIPVVKNLKGLTYNITTDIKADYYYLFATRYETELDEFIEEVVTTNYPQSSKSTKNLSAFRKNEAGGVLGLFFIGLNSDWTKTIVPVGLLVVDNIAPKCRTDNDLAPFSFTIKSSKDISMPKYNIKIEVIDEIVPPIKGGLTLKTHQFHGDEAQFQIDFTGDVESISIKREIHRDYQRYFMRPETKTIKLVDLESPYHFTYALDLGLGDNFIPITVRDLRGNDTTFNYKITMVKGSEDPLIDIDNNITIW